MTFAQSRARACVQPRQHSPASQSPAWGLGPSPIPYHRAWGAPPARSRSAAQPAPPSSSSGCRHTPRTSSFSARHRPEAGRERGECCWLSTPHTRSVWHPVLAVPGRASPARVSHEPVAWGSAGRGWQEWEGAGTGAEPLQQGRASTRQDPPSPLLLPLPTGVAAKEMLLLWGPTQ